MMPYNEFMLRVSWSTNKHPDQETPAHEGQPAHTRRGEVMLDLGLAFEPGDDFTQVEMQAVAFAAKMAALKVLRLRKRAVAKAVTPKKKKAR